MGDRLRCGSHDAACKQILGGVKRIDLMQKNAALQLILYGNALL